MALSWQVLGRASIAEGHWWLDLQLLPEAATEFSVIDHLMGGSLLQGRDGSEYAAGSAYPRGTRMSGSAATRGGSHFSVSHEHRSAFLRFSRLLGDRRVVVPTPVGPDDGGVPPRGIISFISVKRYACRLTSKRLMAPLLHSGDRPGGVAQSIRWSS